MNRYLNLLKDIMENGIDRPTRAKINGENIAARTVFGREMRFDLSRGFPIVTTKKVSFRLVALELAGFIAATRNVYDFQKVDCHIWDGNAFADYWKPYAEFNGDLGRIYGVPWREYISPWDGSKIDQLRHAVDLIKSDPNSRYMVVDSWVPSDIYGGKRKVCLPPCPMNFHFSVLGEKLHLKMVQRSCDSFLGVPFNISSYALLLSLIAHTCNIRPGEFIHSLNDTHIYENHFEQIKEQLSRKPYPLPRLWINPEIKDIDDFRLDKMVQRIETESQFIQEMRKPITIIDDYVKLIDYQSHPTIKGEMAV